MHFSFIFKLLREIKLVIDKSLIFCIVWKGFSFSHANIWIYIHFRKPPFHLCWIVCMIFLWQSRFFSSTLLWLALLFLCFLRYSHFLQVHGYVFLSEILYMLIFCCCCKNYIFSKILLNILTLRTTFFCKDLEKSPEWSAYWYITSWLHF